MSQRRTRLAVASERPFSNGTEGDAWMSKWCSYCARDHAMHDDSPTPCCAINGSAMMGGPWPEAWLPEPDDGEFHLPSRLVCASFTPCTDGGCTGDPGAADRAERVAEVTAYWTRHGAELREGSRG